jgi:hypothetical protein
MTAAHLRAGLLLIYLVAPRMRLVCTERSGCACSDAGAARIAPSAFGTETISSLNDLLPGASQDARHDMNPVSAADVFLTVAIMSVAFLTEIALFILIGMI